MSIEKSKKKPYTVLFGGWSIKYVKFVFKKTCNTTHLEKSFFKVWREESQF